MSQRLGIPMVLALDRSTVQARDAAAPTILRPRHVGAGEAQGGAEEFRRALMAALVGGRGGTFTVDVPAALEATRLATPVRTWLLIARRGTGGTSATVAPEFMGQTYPAMLALVRSINDAGAGDLWRPEGTRSLRLGEARHIFVSADRPVQERTPSPDGLLEVVDAHRIDPDWFAGRVAPRAQTAGLVTVFYGSPEAAGPVYMQVRERSMAAWRRDRVRRHFSL